MFKNKQIGFTLVELLISLVVLAILVALVAPGFGDMIENNRINATTEQLASSVKFARSESIRQGRAVTLCPSSDQATCTGNWHDGWIVFTDVDADRTVDAGTDEVLKIGEGASANYLITLTGAITSSLQFNSQGFATDASTFGVCGPSGEDKGAQGIVIQASGTLRNAADSNADGIRENHLGTAFSC